MKYTGELYGKVAAGYVPLDNTSEQFDRMHEVLKEIIKLKSLIQYTGNIPESQYDEAMAIDNLILKIESILNDLKP